jgi:large subunit ribosomal protein L21
MYAIVENGGKQYKAVEGGFIEIDLLPDEVGKKKTFDKVLLLSTDGGTEVGEPYLKGVSVDTTIISHFKAPKIIVFKYRAKQRYRVKTGHRQKYSRVLIDSIAFPGKSAAAKKSTDTSTSKKAAPVKAVKSTTAAAKKTTSTKAKPTTKAAKKTTSTKAKSTTSKKPVASSAKKSTKTAATKKKPTASKAKTTAKKTAASKATADKKTTSADKK